MNEPLLAQALLTELGKKEKRRIKTAVSWETIGELIRDALDPKPLEEDVTAVTTSPLPVMLPEHPKLKVLYDGKTGTPVEWIVVNNFNEEAPYHAGGWYTVLPRTRPANQNIATTLEARGRKTQGRRREGKTQRRLAAQKRIIEKIKEPYSCRKRSETNQESRFHPRISTKETKQEISSRRIPSQRKRPSIVITNGTACGNPRLNSRSRPPIRRRKASSNGRATAVVRTRTP